MNALLSVCAGSAPATARAGLAERFETGDRPPGGCEHLPARALTGVLLAWALQSDPTGGQRRDLRRATLHVQLHSNILPAVEVVHPNDLVPEEGTVHVSVRPVAHCYDGIVLAEGVLPYLHIRHGA